MFIFSRAPKHTSAHLNQYLLQDQLSNLRIENSDGSIIRVFASRSSELISVWQQCLQCLSMGNWFVSLQLHLTVHQCFSAIVV